MVESLCKLSESYATFRPLVIIEWLSIVVCVATLLLIAFFIRIFFTKSLVLHSNFKVVLAIGGVVYCIHLSIFTCRQLYFRVQYDFIRFDCQGVIVRWKCLLLSGSIIVCVIGFCICHVMLFVERALATLFSNCYEKASKRYGLLCVLVFISILSIWTFAIYSNEDLGLYSDYCFATNEVSSPKMLITFYIMLGLDLACTAGDFVLFILSRRRLHKIFDRNHVNSDSYQLSRAYQLRENKLTISLVFPLSVVHSVFFVLYLSVSTFFRMTFDMKTDKLHAVTAINGAHTIVFVYQLVTCIMLTVLYCRLYRSQQKRMRPVDTKNAGDVYFQMFEKQLIQISA